MAAIAPTPKLQFFAANGTPLVGGKLYTYAAGTTTPLATYTDAGGGTPNTNPVILDSRGEASVWLGSAQYKFKLTTATDVDVWTVDNIDATNVLTLLADKVSAIKGAGLVGFNGSLSYASGTVGAELRARGFDPMWYGAIGNGSSDDTSAVQAALDAAQTAGGYVIFTKIHAITQYAVVRNGVRGLIGMGGGIKCIASANEAGILLLGPKDGGAAPVSSCTISNMQIDLNNRASVSNGIYAQNANNCIVVNNRIINRLNGHGIFFYSYAGATACYGNIISGNTIVGEQATIGAEPAHYMGIAFNSEIDFSPYVSQDTYWKATFTAKESAVPGYTNLISNNHISGAYYGVMVHSSRYTSVQDNLIVGVVRGVSAQDTCVDVKITGNSIFNCRSSGIHLAYGSNNNLISGNSIYSTIAIGEALLQAYVGCNANTFSGNRTASSGSATPQYHAYIGVQSNNNVITGNTFQGTASKAYVGIESAWNTSVTNTASRAYGLPSGVNNFANTGMTDNVVSNNVIDPSTALPAIFLSQISDDSGNYDLSRVRVENNTILNNTPKYQLELFEEHSGSLIDIYAVGNQFYTSAAASKFSFTRGRAHFAAIYGNTVLDETTAPVSFTNADTSPSVAMGRWFQFANSGATSVTMFDDGNDGQDITLRMDINTTIVHNDSYIKCKGAANISGRNANDQVSFRRMGGIWFEQWRSW